MRVTIHDTKGGYEVHAADCDDNAAGGYPLTVEVEDRAAVVHELYAVFARRSSRNGAYKSRRDGLRFHVCLVDLPENSG